VSLTSIRVAGVPEHFNLPWHLGVESGAFVEAGVDLVYQDFPGGTGAMTRALAEGDVDMAVLLTEGAIADLAKRQQTRLVKTYVQSPLIWGIHVAANSSIESIDEINGKRFAISRFGSGSHLMAIVDAAERGWPSELAFEVVKNLDGARAALKGGQADVFMWEQFTTQPIVDAGEFRRVGVRKTLWPAFVIAVNESVLKTNSLAVKKVLDAINQICVALMQDPKAIATISDRYKLRRQQVEQWFSLTKWSTDFECPDESIARALEYLRRLQIIDNDEITIDDIWYPLAD
jgi:ABC-type nitrate/sulfonate/bicarbonate transport system substrate-binding protein